VNALLKRAIAEAERLSDGEQAAIAAIILEEIEAERAWDHRMADTQQQLSELARRARAEVADAGALPFDPSNCPE
jgi:hypothetical protein